MAVRVQVETAMSDEGKPDADIVVVGAGPTGLMLAAELALGGVDVAVVERRLGQDIPGSRAGGLQARTLEVLEQRGVVDRFLAEGEVAQVQSFGGVTLDLAGVPTRHPYGLALWQARIEAILAGWVGELPVRFIRGCSVTGLTQDDAGVAVELDDGTPLRGRFLVGCDGGRSVVRRAVGIAFTGWEASTSYLLAEMTMPDEPPLGFTHDAAGRHAIGPLGDGDGRVRVVVQETPPRAGDTPDADELRAAVIGVWGRDFGLHSPTWISRFSDAARQAESYRAGRVLLAGDAAHVHSPIGGQGLGTGVQDAVNLGWKLAQVARGTAPLHLLDTYHAERHPVGARVLQLTLAQTALTASDARATALREQLADILVMDEPRRHLAATLSGLDIQYALDDDHPLIGRRMPDLDVETATGSTRVSRLLHAARPVLLVLDDATQACDLTPWANRVRAVRGRCSGPWELPLLGVIEAPGAVLIRPDGYVAWAGVPDGSALPRALTTWFGAP